MKRYVLLEDGEIVDRTKAQEFSVYDGEPIKLQSDNLLDLLEVEDCVETINEIYSIDTERELGYQHNFKESIIAIWKRSDNIMRRYEVKE